MADNKEKLDNIRHTAAHVLAHAVLNLYGKKVKFGIGPTIDSGFYYDFEFPSPISEQDLPKIQKEMKKLIKAGLPMRKLELSLEEAKKLLKDGKQEYKLNLVREIEKGERKQTKGTKKENLTFYQIGEFIDLCKGGHAKSTGEIPVDGFKLTHLAGAYWQGDEKNPQLTRIYAAAFTSKKELDEYLEMQEEAKKRDHRKLGRELELFNIADEVGPGLPMFYPKGATLRRLVEEFMGRLQRKLGYEEIWIPHITKGELYKTSGHLEKYDAMYPPMKLKGEADYYLKPMNCPHFMELYRSLPHSYRDLPVRYASTTTNYRYEKSGELTGLARVRAITQDDCHVFCSLDQIEGEINLMLDMIEEVYQAFGFSDFWVSVSTHDPKNKKAYLGDPAVWKKSEQILEKVVKKRKWKYEVIEGEAAFYGPKLDFIFKDVLGREWQLSTVQLDMNLPKRFDLEYTDERGNKQQPIVIHRAVLGSTERFLGILIEHFAGAFPLWLAPVQVMVLPISKDINKYAQKVADGLLSTVYGLRVEIDDRDETIGKKIREAEKQKTPYMLIVGKQEQKQKTVSVRQRGEKDMGGMKLDKFAKQLEKEIQDKKL